MTTRALPLIGALLAAVSVLTACGPADGPADGRRPRPVVATTAAATTTDPASRATATPVTTAAGTPRAAPRPTRPSTTARRTASAVPLLTVVGVTDGDTIKVRVGRVTERVRVIGIDTPELAGRECYAQQAASRMQSLVQGRSVRLVRDPSQDDRDRYDRLLRHVRLADGRSVAELLIAGGYGREYTYDRAYDGRAAHLTAQAAARRAGRGIWSSGCTAGTPVPRTSSRPSGTSSGGCLIKGNISSEGEKIYHVPGQQYYAVTTISTARGERWFCSERDAVASGWRRSLR